MPRLPFLALLAVVIAAGLLVPVGLATAVGVPVVVAAVGAVFAASNAWAYPTEDRSRGELASPLLLALLWGALIGGVAVSLRLDAVLAHYAGGAAGAAARTVAASMTLAVIGVAAGWVAGGLLPGSGWSRAGRPWRKGD